MRLTDTSGCATIFGNSHVSHYSGFPSSWRVLGNRSIGTGKDEVLKPPWFLEELGCLAVEATSIELFLRLSGKTLIRLFISI